MEFKLVVPCHHKGFFSVACFKCKHSFYVSVYCNIKRFCGVTMLQSNRKKW